MTGDAAREVGPPLAGSARDAARLGLFGGSFDPVHAGHLHVARSAAAAADLDHVVFVPAARPPHKPGVRLAGGADRSAMLALALGVEPRWSVWGVELGRDGPSYTIDTVRALVEARGGAGEVFLLVGEDNLDGLGDWRDVEALLGLVRPIVVARAGTLDVRLARLAARLPAPLVERLAAGWVDAPPVPTAATDLRERLSRGEDPGAELPPGVLEYARSRGIYRG